MVKFSIIIPVKEINDYVREFVPIILNQSFKDFEIIIITNGKSTEKFERTRIISSGNKGPAAKRDIGVRKAMGKIIAFIDDDAYPDKDWLKNALPYFKNKEIGVVGGPNLNPKESNFFQQVSGKALESFLVSGPVNYRYKVSKKRYCDDMPSCNFFIRKSTFLELGGFDTSFWPGEDTKLCLEITKLGKKIVYDPKILVYHHRRKDVKGYLNQIHTYAVHRGYFAKKYPENSLKMIYFTPSLFFLFMIIGTFSLFFDTLFGIIYFIIFLIYLLLLFFESLKIKNKNFIIYFIALVFITHMTYGMGFIKGLFKRSLVSKYR